MRMSSTFFAGVVPFLLLASGCGPAAGTCTTGEQGLCGCPEGRIGFQVCGDDGGFDECVCPDACVPRSCVDANASCGAVDDGCGGTLACGVCAATQTCVVDPGGSVCGCATGLVLVGDVCDVDECADELDDCAEDATCRNTVDGFTCSCDPGFVGDGSSCDVDECAAGVDTCAADAACTDRQPGFSCTCNDGFVGDGAVCDPDPATFVADLSATPVFVRIGGVTMPARGLGRISIDVGFTRVEQGDQQRPLATGVNRTPPFLVKRLRGSQGQIDAVRQAAAAINSTSVTVFLNNVTFDERADVVLAAVDVEIVDDAVTDVGNGEFELGAVRIVPAAAARLTNINPVFRNFIPQPRNQILFAVDGITGDSVVFGRYTFSEIAPFVLGAGGLTTVQANRQLDALYGWTANYLDGIFDARGFSRIELDGSDQEVRRVQCYEGLPASLVVFEPTRAFGSAPLSDIVLASGLCEEA